jgi:hypothetical protein
MSKLQSFRPSRQGQTSLLAPSPNDWLSHDHQLYFLLDLVDELDLSAILSPPRVPRIPAVRRPWTDGTRSGPAHERLRQRLRELGFLPLEPNAAYLFFQLLPARQRLGAVVAEGALLGKRPSDHVQWHNK